MTYGDTGSNSLHELTPQALRLTRYAQRLCLGRRQPGIQGRSIPGRSTAAFYGMPRNRGIAYWKDTDGRPTWRVVALIHRRQQSDAGVCFWVRPSSVLWWRLRVPVLRYWAINRVICCREYPLTLLASRLTKSKRTVGRHGEALLCHGLRGRSGVLGAG